MTHTPIISPNNTPITIVGAGLAGLLAAHAWPRAAVLEAAPEPVATHRAVLRFRTDAVAAMTGIEFRRVRVHKAIVLGDGTHVAPSIDLANLYAQKVTGGALVGERSVWSVEPVDRFIAPESLHEQLLDAVGERVRWNTPADFSAATAGRLPVVSTAPMFATLEALSIAPDAGVRFERAAIRVRRFRLRRADVFQTVYFPACDTAVYRASITGSLLIIESMLHRDDSGPENDADNLRMVLEAFGILSDPEPIDDAPQRFGKIVPLPDAARRALLFRMTHERGIYSLGRFATWRNVLLDDVVHDIGAIRRLMRSDAYSLRRAAS